MLASVSNSTGFGRGAGAGARALAACLRDGAAPELEWICLDGNPGFGSGAPAVGELPSRARWAQGIDRVGASRNFCDCEVVYGGPWCRWLLVYFRILRFCHA